MAIRARFETETETLTISRGVLTVHNGETGIVERFPVKGVEFNEDTRSLFVDVMGEDKHFTVTKTPREIRHEMLAAFVPTEHGRLKGLVHASNGEAKLVEAAQANLSAFETKYRDFLPKPEPKEPKEKAPKKAKKAKN